MRRQDEIRLLFPNQVPANQKFLLSELDGFARAFDADEILDLLRSTMSGGATTLARQALATATSFLPPYVERCHGISGEQAGVWSQYMAEPVAMATAADERAKAEELHALRARAIARLMPLFNAFSGRLEDLPESVKPTAWLMLALLPEGHVHAKAFLEKKPVPFNAVWAWAAGGGGASDPQRLTALLDRLGPGEPDVLLAALALPAEPLAALAARLAGRVDWKGAAHLAMALGRVGGPDALTRLEELSLHPTGWGDVYVLRAVEALGQQAGLKLVRHLHARAVHEFVRRQALRAAGGFVSEDAVSFCLSSLSGSEGSVTAQALESLVRLRCPRDDLLDAAKTLVSSGDLRVRVNALLATVDPDLGKLPKEFVELLRSDDPLARVEAAFCLGYWPSKGARDALAHFAAHDREPAVRVQAIKSLSKYGALRALPVLTQLVESAPPAEAALAARLVERLAPERMDGIAEFFTKELAKHEQPERRALLLTALAGISVRSPSPGVEDILARALDSDSPVILMAALDAWKRLAARSSADLDTRLSRAMAHEDPRISASAAVVAVLRGNLKAIDELAAGVRAGAPEAKIAAHAHAALELALIATSVLAPAHAALARALEQDAARPAPSIGWMPPKSRVAAPAPAPDAEEAVADGAATLREGELKDLLAELRAKESAPPKSMRIGDFGRRLEAQNYLVVPKTAAVALEAESRRARAARGFRQAAALARQHPVLLVPVASLAVILGVVLFAPGEAPVRFEVPAAPALTSVITTGKATVTGTPLAASDVVRVGQEVKLAGAEARFQTDAGDDVKLLADGAMTVVEAGGADGLVLAPRAGTLEVAFGPGQRFLIKSDKRRVQGISAKLRCEVREDSWIVEVKFGDVMGTDAGGSRTLAVGSAHTLK
jgi:hypothetical protein